VKISMSILFTINCGFGPDLLDLFKNVIGVPFFETDYVHPVVCLLYNDVGYCWCKLTEPEKLLNLVVVDTDTSRPRGG